MSDAMYPPVPGTMPPTMPAPARRGNGAAITALVCGLLLCIPFLTGLLAVIFGAVGLKKAREPGRGGKGLALTGLILGLVNLIGWAASTPATIGWIKTMTQQVTAQNETAKAFIKDLASADVVSAKKKCHSNMKTADLLKSVVVVKTWGAYQDTTVSGFNAHRGTGGDVWVINGTARFAKGDHAFTIKFGMEGGEWKIVEYDIKP